MAQVQVRSKNIEYEVLGSGEPVIVLLNGHNTPMTSWAKVTASLKDVGTVLLYNRLGVGLSDRPTEPQNGLTVSTQLLSILEALSINMPIVLVGHSLGGLYANLFARLHVEKVRAIVLVESGHPDEAIQREQNLGFLGKLMEKLLSSGASSFRNDPNSEYNSVSTTVRQIKEAPSFPDVPLVVISGTQKMPFVPRESFAQHLEMQDRLANLVAHSTHLKAERSGHFPQLSQPELVSEAIANAARLPGT